MENKVKAGIMGVCIGDALGVPVEFRSREELKRSPVTKMRAFWEPIVNLQGHGVMMVL